MTLRFDYSGCVVLVTGGTQGIGFGIASAFADAGACVHITGTRAAADDYANDLSRFSYHRVRMENPAERAALSEAIAELDILVNNAGAAGDDEYSLEGHERIIEINLNAVVDLCYRFRERLSARKGAIVNIASVASFIGMRDQPAYAASKHGLVGFTRSIADLWAKYAIRCNAVAPGFVDTAIIEWARSDAALMQKFVQAIPERRIGTPEEIAACVLFLASPQASYVRGHTLVADGGYTLR
ncbi:SDR family NAD(P)-dependent oxidoreductase [Sphingosinithalassobacter portus]|uniref:SDR family NAD(P)-dependent oxidoreductase n=1 Tax=Stakelama portus TaxID=2676234 RepID=UPI000D6E3A0A|nr:SDR family NAD(P)-dependent oxidoreductase [Sphingosinithalassobacter portus]